MGKLIRKWTEVRELNSEDRSEISYIRNADIVRISLVEEDLSFSVLVHTKTGSYLYSRHESMSEASISLEALTTDMET